MHKQKECDKHSARTENVVCLFLEQHNNVCYGLEGTHFFISFFDVSSL